MRCAHCAAALGPNAAWCGQCLAPVAAAPVAVGVLDRPDEPAPYDRYAPTAASARLPRPMPATVLPAPAPRGRPEKAFRTVLLAVGTGVVAQVVAGVTTRGVENETAIRYALVTTLGVYLVVALLLIRRRAAAAEPMYWGRGRAVPSALVGLAVGGGLAAFLLSGSHAAGQQGGDPRIALLVSEGDLGHVLGAALITVVAAPFLEEVLFRGMLLASLSDRGKRAAVWLSAFAFAAWHLTPSAFVYYSLMGALLGGLFVRRGLIGSMAAHAAFNGVLTAVAVSYALAPGAVGHAGALTVTAPHGWHAHESPLDVHLVGPSAGEIIAQDITLPGAVRDADAIADRLQAGAIPGTGPLAPRLETLRIAHLRVGDAAVVDITMEGHRGELVMLPRPGGVYLLVLASAGSPRARHDFDRVLKDLTLSPSP
ncbi:MAG TPA: CPBP family intramembrane glutamic endopeptidase [Mycobacteriales bacterium]|jgi:membrane protease YdiL (CAAX protease family)|nr:CPBP family intramembrane glutamic endopeptidase [Mycobacteriales bacterium]